MRRLPDIASTANSVEISEEKDSHDLSIFDSASLSGLLEILKADYGRKSWKCHVRNVDGNKIKKMLSCYFQDSEFDTFTQKVMTELTPFCGQKILAYYLSQVRGVLQCVIKVIQSKIEYLFDSCTCIDEKVLSNEHAIQGLTTAINRTIPHSLQNDVPHLRIQLLTLKNSLMYDMLAKTRHCSEELKNGLAVIKNYYLHRPPEEERDKLQNISLLCTIRSEFYWEVSESNVWEFKRVLHSFMENSLSNLYKIWLTEVKSLLHKSFVEFKSRLVQTLERLTAVPASWISAIDNQNCLWQSSVNSFELPIIDISFALAYEEKIKVSDDLNWPQYIVDVCSLIIWLKILIVHHQFIY